MATELQPYVGPRPFEQRDAEFFFGREREASELASLIIAHEAVLLYAQSGAGKTSLLNARVIPMLTEKDFEILPVARVQGPLPQDLQPQAIPNIYIFNTLMSWIKERVDLQAIAQLSLVDYLKQQAHPLDEEGLPKPRLVVFDQFEELFTAYPHRWQDRQDFFQQVQMALEEDDLLRVLFSMREDRIAHLDPYVQFLPENLRMRYRVERLRKEAALAAVIGPLNVLRQNGKVKYFFKPGAAEKLVQDLMTIQVETEKGQAETAIGEFAEPVQLQVACQSLWQNLPPDVEEITEGHLDTFGNVNQALARFYETCIEMVVEHTRVGEVAVRDWFEEKLITSTGTRGIVYKDEGLGETGGIPNTAVAILENQHLIRREWRSGSPWYELAHDRFIEPIRESNKAFRQAKSDSDLKQLKIETLKKRHFDLETRREEAARKMDEVKNEFERLRLGKQIEILERDISKTANELGSLTQEASVAPLPRQQKIKILQERVTALMEDYKAVWERLDYTLSDVESTRMKRHINGLEQEITQVQSELESLGATLMSISFRQVKISALAKHRANLKKELEMVRSASSTAINDDERIRWERHIKQLEQEINEVNKELEIAQDEVNIRVQALQERLTGLMKDHEAAQDQLDRTFYPIDRPRLKRQIEQLEQEITQAQSELESLGATPMSISFQQVNIGALAKRRADLKEELEITRSALSTTIGDIDRMRWKRQIEELEQEVNEVDKKLEIAQDEVNVWVQALQKRLTGLMEDCEEAHRQLDCTLNPVDCHRLKGQIKDLEQEITEVESKLKALQ